MLLGVLTVVLGAALVFWPVQGLVTLATVLVVYLIAHGICNVLLVTCDPSLIQSLGGSLVEILALLPRGQQGPCGCAGTRPASGWQATSAGARD
jgi:Short repeat of unknown function (DUF308)